MKIELNGAMLEGTFDSVESAYAAIKAEAKRLGLVGFKAVWLK